MLLPHTHYDTQSLVCLPPYTLTLNTFQRHNAIPTAHGPVLTYGKGEREGRGAPLRQMGRTRAAAPGKKKNKSHQIVHLIYIKKVVIILLYHAIERSAHHKYAIVSRGYFLRT